MSKNTVTYIVSVPENMEIPGSVIVDVGKHEECLAYVNLEGSRYRQNAFGEVVSMRRVSKTQIEAVVEVFENKTDVDPFFVAKVVAACFKINLPWYKRWINKIRVVWPSEKAYAINHMYFP